LNRENLPELIRVIVEGEPMTPQSVAKLSSLPDRKPQYALVGEVDLVVEADGDDIIEWAEQNPKPFNSSAYLGLYGDTKRRVA
jgi:hypothetical protein